MMTVDNQAAQAALDSRLKAILPEEYQDAYDEVLPVSMGSAGLKYGCDGKVAWNEIWGSFCDLAMAGGPPHKGSLLEPGSPTAVEAQPGRYEQVVAEICRGILMVTGLPCRPSPSPGWIRVVCHSEGMADWLVRAIVMENVSARREARALDLPAAPQFRLEKEIKNVVTVIAKTCHYWSGHMSRAQQRAVAQLFAKIAAESRLIEPALDSVGVQNDRGQQELSARLAESIQATTGLRVSAHRYTGWLGVECPNVRAAIWMMRAMVVANVLSRREGTVLFVPVNPVSDPDGAIVASAAARVHSLATAAGVCQPA
jgi:sirohydrochlorin cobaltochelatase